MRRRLWQLWSVLSAFANRRALAAAKEADDRRSNAARVRFWTELREGQREAEAHAGVPRS